MLCLKKLALSPKGNILSIYFVSVFWSYHNDRIVMTGTIDRVVLNALKYTVSSLPGFYLSISVQVVVMHSFSKPGIQ